MNFHRKGVYSYYLGTGIHVGLDFGCFQIESYKICENLEITLAPSPKDCRRYIAC